MQFFKIINKNKFFWSSNGCSHAECRKEVIVKLNIILRTVHRTKTNQHHYLTFRIKWFNEFIQTYNYTIHTIIYQTSNFPRIWSSDVLRRHLHIDNDKQNWYSRFFRGLSNNFFVKMLLVIVLCCIQIAQNFSIKLL